MVSNLKAGVVVLMQRYNISKQDVFLAFLIADGMPPGDAFESLFHILAKDPTTACRRYLTGKPSIETLADAIRRERKLEANGDTPKTPSRTKSSDLDLRTKDGVLSALEKELSSVTEPKQRTEIIGKIADLQRMKNEEDRENRKLINYYLPLRCEECPYKSKADKIYHHPDVIL